MTDTADGVCELCDEAGYAADRATHALHGGTSAAEAASHGALAGHGAAAAHVGGTALAAAADGMMHAARQGVSSAARDGVRDMARRAASELPRGMGMNNTVETTIGTGAAMATTGYAARGVLRRFFGNPWVALGIGVAAGYLTYKYRKEIAAAVTKTTDLSKDFVLQQKEKLSDIVEETKEGAEQQGGGE